MLSQTGRQIKRRRRELQLTQAELATRACLSKGYVWRIERGLQDPTVGGLKRIAKALGVPPGALLS